MVNTARCRNEFTSRRYQGQYDIGTRAPRVNGLKDEPQRELNRPWIIDLGRNHSGGSIRCRCDGGVGRSELDAIKQVVELGPKFHVQPFRDRSPLEKRRIVIRDPRSTKYRAWCDSSWFSRGEWN